MQFFKPLDTGNDEEKKTPATTEKVKCLIVGSGPAGYTAAIYTARANLGPVMYTGLQQGGQLTTTTDVENYPGYPDGVTGPEMMEDFRKQAERFGTDIRLGTATSTDFSGKPLKVTFDNSIEIHAETVIIATGATAKYLGIPAETKYAGMGVSACATCDGFFYKGKDVAVVGGGDTACEEATYLAGMCKKVYMVVRRDVFRASIAMQQRVMNTPNIEILWNCQVEDLFGTQGVEGAVVVRQKGTPEEEKFNIKIEGFFLAIGHTPNSDIFKPWLETDETGYIITEPGSTRTRVPGVFASGDVMDHVYRQAVTAAGSGCRAAIDAERYLAEKVLEKV
ncbi:MAG: thioredoxin-disulfide reductase [Bacteroidales bacterium]|nr:thioredoxin-disulfide reductase [Bacteroidales bacterium]